MIYNPTGEVLMNCYYNLLKLSLINDKKFRLVTGWNDFMVEGDGEVQVRDCCRFNGVDRADSYIFN